MPGPNAVLSAEPARPVLPARRLPAAPASPESVEDPKLKGACEEMEALFLHHLLSEMRKTVAKSGLLDGGRAEEIYTSLMDAELAQQMARDGGLGLSSLLLQQTRARDGFKAPDHACSRIESGTEPGGCGRFESPVIPSRAGAPGPGRNDQTTSKVTAGPRR
jgi:Rod binding domain-containing protein